MSNSRDFRMSALPTPPRGAGRAVFWIAGAAVIVVLISVFMSANTVQAGHVGVLLTFGRVDPGVLYPGFHLIVPGVQKIEQVDTRVLPHAFNQIDAASRELQTVKLTGTMNYHLEPSRANELYQTVGLDFASKVIDPAFNDFIKEVVPSYPVTEILARRDEIRTQARVKLSANLERYGIVVDDIYLSNIAFSADYQGAIERKQTAQQNVETEQQLLAQKQIQAQQNVVEAKGRADAAVETAQGEAKANEVRTASISPQLIDYIRWTRWDGKLPLFSGGGATPLISVPIPGVDGTTPATTAPAAAPTVAPAAPVVSPTARPAGATPTVPASGG